MVGIVVVSHSRKIAEGVVELAREMGGDEVLLGAAGGTDEPDALGTDALRVLEAINDTYSDDGVLVMMDLGSAVMSAEMAVEMLAEDRRAHVTLCEAPLVEGTVAAATAAKLGRALGEVAAEARGGLAGKASHLGVGSSDTSNGFEQGPLVNEGAPVESRIVIDNPLGLHARPAARFVGTVGEHDARIEVENLTAGRGPATGTSLNSLTTLGIVQGSEILVRAWGPGAEAAIAALEELAGDNFGDPMIDEPPDDRGPAQFDLPEGGVAGLAASPGVALGAVRHLRRADPDVPDHNSDDPEHEIADLEKATRGAATEIEGLRAQVARNAGDYEAQIFDAHLLMLQDESLRERAASLIRDKRSNAANALWTVVQESAAELESVDNERLRERSGDLLDVGRRVVAHLMDQPPEVARLDQPGILVIRELTPSDAAGLDTDMVLGIATATGGPTSHGAILARALGVPAVVGLGDSVLAVAEASDIIVDGDRGIIIVDPSPAQREHYEGAARAQGEAAAASREAATEPAVTADGAIIEVAANIGSASEASKAVRAGADGVGLLRTEFLFLGRSEMPSEDEQREVYLAIARALEGRPLTVRTLDVGADKPLTYLHLPTEANPFLGVRGIRLSLAERDLLTTQLRALARVALAHPVRVMFPMVANLDEFMSARSVLQEALNGGKPVDLQLGIMVEVPAAALTAERFAPHVDFFSIGTNDLSQYTMAADRGNAKTALLADPLHPAVLRLIAETVRAAASYDAWVGVCGEIAGDPLATSLLLGLGATELSMSPPAIAAIKDAVRATKREDAFSMAERALECDSGTRVRELLREHAQ